MLAVRVTAPDVGLADCEVPALAALGAVDNDVDDAVDDAVPDVEDAASRVEADLAIELVEADRDEEDGAALPAVGEGIEPVYRVDAPAFVAVGAEIWTRLTEEPEDALDSALDEFAAAIVIISV